jgi:hypothetical protein
MILCKKTFYGRKAIRSWCYLYKWTEHWTYWRIEVSDDCGASFQFDGSSFEPFFESVYFPFYPLGKLSFYWLTQLGESFSEWCVTSVFSVTWSLTTPGRAISSSSYRFIWKKIANKYTRISFYRYRWALLIVMVFTIKACASPDIDMLGCYQGKKLKPVACGPGDILPSFSIHRE